MNEWMKKYFNKKKVISFAEGNLRKPFNSESIFKRESVQTVHGSVPAHWSSSVLQTCSIKESNSFCFRKLHRGSICTRCLITHHPSPVTCHPTVSVPSLSVQPPPGERIPPWSARTAQQSGWTRNTAQLTHLIDIHWLFRVLSLCF